MNDNNVLNGYIMSEDIPVVKVENDRITYRDYQRCPLMLREGDNILLWLKSRAADNSRVNTRLLKKALGLKKTGDIETSLFFNAATITDNFWFKDVNSSLEWEDVKFKFNHYAKLALNGDLEVLTYPKTRTPELTNIGSFDKCWVLEDDKWWLHKKANEEQKYCEFYISELGSKVLGFNMAKYEMLDNSIKTLDFTENGKYNFEPAYSIVKDNEDYDFCFKKLFELKPSLAPEYLKIIYMDSLCLNMDRHTFNFGVLRDSHSGEVIKMAPNFDNNVALMHNGKYPDIKTNTLDNFFIDFLNNNQDALDMFNSLKIENITLEKLNSITDNIETKINKEKINNYIFEHQKNLDRRIKDLEYNRIIKHKEEHLR